VTEWWQEGADDIPAEIPRRDYVPPADLSDPRAVLTNPEVTRFVPEGHGWRILIAWIVTGITLLIVVAAVLDLVHWTQTTDLNLRSLGLPIFAGVVIRIVLSAAVVWFVWRWARQIDPRDRGGSRFIV
jgi:hypothetical protein